MLSYTPATGSFPVGSTNKFPVGIYHITHYPYQKAQRLIDIQIIANLGFDYIATPIDENDAAVFTLCESLNLGVMVEYNGDPATIYGLFGSSPVFFSQLVGDDIDVLYGSRVAFQAANTAAKARSTSKITFGSVSNYNNVATYAGVSDWLGDQWYPIGYEAMSSAQSYFPPCVTACAGYSQPFHAHIQTFAWPTKAYPTPEELKAMLWSGVMLGSNGILCYTYADGTASAWVNQLDWHPELRAELEVFIRKIRQFEDFFVLGTRTVTTQNGTLMDMTWTIPNANRKLRMTLTYATLVVTFQVTTV